MKITPLLTVLVLFAAGTFSLRAQPAPVQQIQNSRLTQQSSLLPSLAPGTNAPELYQGENEDVGPQYILQLKPQHKYFNVLLDSQLFYTDNANFAASKQKIGSSVYLNTLQAAFIPPSLNLPTGTISTSIGAASQWYNYENRSMDGLDFDAQTFFGGAKYSSGKWLVAVDLSYTRLVSQPYYALEYQEILPAFTLQRFVPINNRMLITLSDQVDYHFTDQPSPYVSYGTNSPPVQATHTEINNRLDNILGLTFTWQLAEKLYFQPAYRFVFTNYRYNTLENSDRNDYLNSFGASLAYYFNQYCSIRTFFNYNAKCTDDPNAIAYHEANGGAGISVNIIF